MSLSDLLIKVLGIILAVVGLILVLSAVGIQILGGAGGLEPAWLGILVGLLFIGIGIWIIRGGNLTF